MTTRRSFIGSGAKLSAAALAALSGLANFGPSLTGGSSAEAAADKPTVVLVHGAWADGTGWSEVTKRLQDAGYTVLAAPNPLRSLSSDSAYLRSFLAFVKGDVVLVGHSYGGAVVTNTAGDVPSVRALVYVNAFVPDAGESALDLATRFPGSKLGDETLQPSLYPGADGTPQPELFIRRDRFREVFAGDLPQAMAATIAASQRPVAPAALGEPAQAAAWKTLPSWYLVGTADMAIPPATQRFMANRAGSTVVEVNASHASFISAPGAVVNLIDAAAAAAQ
jgi:pimeloyl-ACP methyl ester carboxylesterase